MISWNRKGGQRTMQRTGTCGVIQLTLYNYSRKVLWQKTLVTRK